MALHAVVAHRSAQGDDRRWVCFELHERFLAFQRRDLHEIRLVALFLDAIYLSLSAT
jgi:hypothetical protein